MLKPTIVAGLLLIGCVPPPKAPGAPEAYLVKVMGATERPARNGTRVFTSEPGKEFTIEITNDSSADVGVTIVIDGLDARRGVPVSSCEQGAGWITPTSGRLVADGFEIGSHQIAAYRFAPRENALAALLVEGHPESVGSIEVCFFSVKTREPRDAGGETTSPAPPVLETKENQPAPTIIAVVREDKSLPEMRRTRDVLLSRVRLVTEDSAGQALGAAPPPPVARTIPPPSASPPATLSSPDDDMESPPPAVGPKPTSPIKSVKRPVKGNKPHKP